MKALSWQSSHHPSFTQQSMELARETGPVHPEVQAEALLKAQEWT